MPSRTCLSSATLLMLLGLAAPALPQIQIPNQQHQSLTVELHSVRDQVTMYIGDPQDFLLMYLHPISIPPRIDFNNSAGAAVLRIRDQTLFEGPPPIEEEYLDGEEFYSEEQERVPDSQAWDIRLSPASPADFVIECVEGSGTFDFTDLQVQDVYLFGDSTELQVEFSRQNPIDLERFKLILEGGALEFQGMLNARARSMTITAPRAKCELELTGKPFNGEAEIFFEGVPKSLDLLVSRKIGLRVDGPALTIARFDSKDMRRQDLSLVTHNYDSRKCRIRLHFAEAIPDFKVEWD